MTDDVHTPTGGAGSPEPGVDVGPPRDVVHAAPVPGTRASTEGFRGRRAAVALGHGLKRFGRWLATWGRRLAPSPFLWIGIVLGFGTSLLVWESVLLLGVAVWLLGVWLWKTRGSPVFIALGLGMVLGWLPMLFFFVNSLPHTMVGLPGVEYDL